MSEEVPTQRCVARGLADRPLDRKQTFPTVGTAMGPLLLWVQDVAAVTLLKARRTLLRAAIFLCVLILLLWVSIFLYGSFYYSYMPSVSFSTPVHYLYRTDCDVPDSALCSFPVANVSLLKNGREQVMMFGQAYRISLELELPESPVNEQLGMFMVKMTCYSRDGNILDSVARSTMLHYRSSLLQSMSTLFFSPLLLSGVSEQKQLIEVELLPRFTPDPYHPAVGALIEIQSRRVQIYSAQLRIHAYFTGVRYLLYNFPVMSAVAGVLSNFTFLAVIVLFSYLQFIWGGLYPPEQVRVKVMMADSTRLQQRREDARKRMRSSASTPTMAYARDGSELEDPFKTVKQTVRNKADLDTPTLIGTENLNCLQEDEMAQGASTEEEPIYLEAPRVDQTNVPEEHMGSEAKHEGEEGNGTRNQEEPVQMSSDSSIRQRLGPRMRL